VRVRSVAGRGTSFRIDVPAAGAIEAATARPDEARMLSRFDGMRVLLIDDDSLAREATRGLLAGWGCTVHPTGASGDTWSLFADASPALDLVICDYHLGDDGNGIDLVKAIRAATGRETSAVIVSADTSDELRALAAAAHMPLLHKPLKAARLRAFLQLVAHNGSRSTDA
jgi:two-component system, sensor histidine kinase